MSILHYNMAQQVCDTASVPKPLYVNEFEERSKRNAVEDLKEGIDLIFQLKGKIDKFHPIATETLIRLLCM